MNSNFNVEDRVNVRGYGKGTIKRLPGAGTNSGMYAIELDTPHWDHNCGGLTKEGHGMYAFESRLTLIPAKPKRTFTPTSQNGMILSHLLSGGALTRVTADHLYRVASLTRRIRDLRDAGHKIIATQKEDHTGRPYVEYTMRVNKGR